MYFCDDKLVKQNLYIYSNENESDCDINWYIDKLKRHTSAHSFWGMSFLSKMIFYLFA